MEETVLARFFQESVVGTIDMAMLDVIRENLQCGFLDWFMPLVSSLGNFGIFWILVAAFLCSTKKYRKTGIMVAFSLILGLLIGNLTLKPLVGRLRPFEVDPGLTLLIPAPGDASFPSGHTLASFEAATVLMIREKKTMGIPALILASLIGCSRLYLQVHFPTDVLFGALLGVVNGWIAVKCIDVLWERRNRKIGTDDSLGKDVRSGTRDEE